MVDSAEVVGNVSKTTIKIQQWLISEEHASVFGRALSATF
jgi:hypothetical protein